MLDPKIAGGHERIGNRADERDDRVLTHGAEQAGVGHQRLAARGNRDLASTALDDGAGEPGAQPCGAGDGRGGPAGAVDDLAVVSSRQRACGAALGKDRVGRDDVARSGGRASNVERNPRDADHA